jgi:uncharacterized membrane protein YkoI
MNTRTLILAIAASFSLSVSAAALAVEGHSHGAHADTQKLTLDQGRKWATDEHLRRGMQEIRAALESAHGTGHDREITPAQYQALGQKLEVEIGAIVSRCKLEPAADANLHVVLAELNSAASTFKRASGAEAEQALQRAATATNAYGRHFDHPGWKSLLAADAAKAPLDLTGAIELVSSTYPGRTVAAQADPTGGEGMHYHVDTLLPNGRLARFDVDARTHRIYNRLPAEEAPADALSLKDAVKTVQKQTRGRVLSAEYDPDPQPHYHMNVRLPGGQLTRMDLDLANGKAVKHAPRS